MTLTADEAAARAALLSVARYDVRFDLREFAARGTFRTHARVEFGCAAPGAASWIDLLARAVRRARLNGADLDLARCWDGERIALAGLAERNVLVVESEHDAGAGRGLSRSVDPADGAVYAWTQFQPYDARRAFACFDQPSLKAPVAIAAIVPDGWTCVSNGVARMGDADGDDADGGDAEGGARTWTFSTTPPLPTYAMAFAAGPFHVVAGHVMEGTAVTGTAVTGAVVGQPGPAGPVGPPGPAGPVGAVAVRLHARRSLAARLDRDAPELLALTAAGLEFFGREFDLPYPASSYDYVFLPDQPGAMENFGCVTWGDAVLRPEAPTDSQRQRRASVLLHEMAHMWFGDLVTPAWWDGLWLNESFASWAGGWAEAALRGDDVGWQRFLLTREIPAQLADDGPTSHPIDRPVPDVDAAEANFDLITYVKGTAVLRQLVAWVGEEAFLTGIRRYFRRFAWRNATMADLLDELSAASGRELRSWAGDWLGRAGVNTVSVAASVSGAGGRDLAAGERYESVELVQDGGGGPRPHRLRLGVYDADPDGALRRREVLELDLTGARVPVPELAGAPRAALLLPNEDDLTFAQVRLDDDSVRALRRGAHTLPAGMSRAVALTALRAMVVEARLPAALFVPTVLRCVTVESDAATVDDLLSIAIEAATIYCRADRRDELTTQIADCCRRGRASAANEPLRRVFLAAFARCATSAGQLAELRALAEPRALARALAAAGDDRDEGLAATTGWAARIRLAAMGGDGVRGDGAGLAGGDSVGGHAAFESSCVRAATPDPAAKGVALDRVLADRVTPVAQLGQLADALWQPGQEELLRPLAARYIEALPSLAGDSEAAALRNVIGYTFPFFGVDEALLARAQAIAATLRAPLAARNSLREQLLRLDGALRARR